ncbi:MAG: oxidative damage protection protein [Gammaproteobacteria bacterium]|nr:MAG: oxidative damage protection protein [Gammaproteobacteria bacterium]
MTRTVHCEKYQSELEGLLAPPFPGKDGEHIYNTVSKKAWMEWLQHQTMLINENQLNVLDPTAKTFLDDQRAKFFANLDYERPKGYVAPK